MAAKLYIVLTGLCHVAAKTVYFHYHHDYHSSLTVLKPKNSIVIHMRIQIPLCLEQGA